MNAIETRLSDRQATLAGITRAINQHLGHTPLARVELRYSTQANVPLAPQQAKQTIANLLREHGQGAAAISVRAHEGPIDDATGEHLLRLIPAVPSKTTGSAEPSPAPNGWRGWLARWLPGLFASKASVARVEPGLAVPQPAVSRILAVKLLREAVRKATAFVETDTGTAIGVGREADAHALGRARVIVRQESLHQVLEPLVQQDPRAIALMVKAAGLALTSNFSVVYSFEAVKPGDGTGYANESDVEVRLILGAERSDPANVPRVKSGTAMPIVSARAQHPVAGGTAMPVATGHAANQGVTVRVVGTLAQTFAQPFDLGFASLPARFDRTALEQAGFDQVHPGLLAVASNSCPLVIRRGPSGALLLNATARGGNAGVENPMYFSPDSLNPLKGELTWLDSYAPIVVNAPGGVQDPATGRMLPALVIEVWQGVPSGSAQPNAG